MSSLRVLHLSGCTKLESTPDFTRATHLEYLDMDNCSSLSTMHESIGVLSNLTFLSLRGCIELVSIPTDINSLEPCNFRCGFDIVNPWEWAVPKRNVDMFGGDSIIRIVECDTIDNWIGFTFCVIFKGNNSDAIAKSPHSSFSSTHPFYLSFESEYTEEYFDMRLNLEENGSEYIWIIYISREHCHFVKTGAHITFKAQPSVKIQGWWMDRILKKDIHDLRSCSGPKIQLPYNWYVTEEEEVENIDAKSKENNLSNAGL
ncbi:hypothetical protein ACSQ67_009141 [Phaseolus vulgaris]